jgi:hypothetical protein
MSDDRTVPPFVYEGFDPVAEPKSALAQAVEAAKEAVHSVGEAIDKGRKPGMPLNILSSVAREAPAWLAVNRISGGRCCWSAPLSHQRSSLMLCRNWPSADFARYWISAKSGGSTQMPRCAVFLP